MSKLDQAQFAASLAQALQPADMVDDGMIDACLAAVRTHLGLQVAYLSEMIDERSVYRNVDAPGLEHLIAPGDERSLDDVYCRHILAGRLPELIPDTADEPLARDMPITDAVPIGAHVSVPVRLGNGELYGMFCCLGPKADRSLNDRDLLVMRSFADLVANRVDRRLREQSSTDAARARVADAIEHGLLRTVYQPVVEVPSGTMIGLEALSRFDDQRPPDIWFTEAAQAGLQTQLELFAIEKALEALDRLPPHLYLTINCSPETIESELLLDLLADVAIDRIVIEVTEHARVDDMGTLKRVLAPLRDAGLRVAVDDAGAGYSGLQQILTLKPDIVKLDRFFAHSIDLDPGRRALAAALVTFAEETGCDIIAEGVESESELQTLSDIGFSKIQGYLFGEPAALDRWLAPAS